jgi:VIT1/CCC1 family predicted Fe2+/Mn2+ transporter
MDLHSVPFLFGTKAALVISTLLLAIAAGTTAIGGRTKNKAHTKRTQRYVAAFIAAPTTAFWSVTDHF